MRLIRSLVVVVAFAIALWLGVSLVIGDQTARDQAATTNVEPAPLMSRVRPAPATPPARRETPAPLAVASPSPESVQTTATVSVVPATPVVIGSSTTAAVTTSPPEPTSIATTTEPPAGEAVIPASDEPADAQGRVERVHLVRRAGKYPLVRIEDQLGADGKILRRREMVGDHVMVSVKAGTTPADVAAVAQRHDYQVRRRLGASNVYLIAFPVTSHGDLPEALASLSVEGVAASKAEVDWIVYAIGTPNDSSFGQLWGMHNTGQSGGTADADIDAPEAWDISTGSTAVKVGVIDTGIDYNHPDLAANCWVNPGESGLDGGGLDKRSNGIDDDGNGYIDDWRGWDFLNNDNDPWDDHYHGTHCAGTIGGVGDNGVGVTGVCWRVSLIGIKFLGANGGSTSDAIESVAYGTLIGCDLTSNSWGGGGFSQTLKDTIDQANVAGVLFVAAAGNSAENNDVSPHYPSSYESANIIAVAATTRTDALSSFSCWGPTSVDIGAPGSDVYSCKPNNAYQLLSGTSMATPHVAGACALLKSLNPSLTGAQIRQALLATTDPIAALAGKCVTGGRLNLYQALLTNAGPQVAKHSQVISEIGNGNGTLNPGEAANIAVTLRGAGIGPVTDAVGTLTSSDSAATIEAGLVTYGTLNPGQTSAGSGSFRMRLAAGTPTPRIVAMTLTVTSPAGGPWLFPITATFSANATISGRITASAGGAAIAGANVTLAGTTTAATTTNAVGNYSFAVLDGTYTVTAAANSYVPSSPITVVCPPDATNVNIQLAGAPDIVVNPSSLSATAALGSSTTQSVTIANPGGSPLNWTLAQPANSYVISNSDQSGGPTYNWIDISTTGTPVAMTGDDQNSGPYPLGFSFPFFGQTFANFRVCTNGWLSFTSSETTFTNTTLPSTSAPENLVAICWDDLDFSSTPRVFYKQIDANTIVVQYQNVPYYADSTKTVTCQAILSADGTLIFQYEHIDIATDCTVGVQDATRTKGSLAAYNQSLLHGGMAVRLVPTGTWLTLSPTSGTTAAGATTPITATFTSGTLPLGTYTTSILVASNDLETPVVTVPVTFTIAAVAPPVTTTLQNGLNGYVGTLDSYMSNSSPTNTLGGSTWTITQTNDQAGTDGRIVLVKFPIFAAEGGPVPNGATVVSATLSLYQYSAIARGFGAHRLLKGWNETATSWNNALIGVPWTAAGANGSGSDMIAIADGTGATAAAAGWLNIDVTAGAQAFATGTANHGWRLKGIGTTSASVNFRSREQTTDSTQRPKLTITYTTGPANAVPVITQAAAASPNPVLVGTSTTLTVSATDADNDLLAYDWSFGDGTTGSGNVIAHTYATAGTYSATVTVTDGRGVSVTSSISVTVAAPPTSTIVTLQHGLNGYVVATDSYLSDGSPTNTQGGVTPTITATHNPVGADSRVVLVRFPIFVAEGGPVPNGATVVSATLSLYQYSPTAHALGAHRVLKAWNESSTSWINASSGVPWTVAGASGAGSDIVMLADGSGTATAPGWLNIDVTSGAQAFAGGTTNLGWRLKGIGTASGSENFRSREYLNDSTQRPKLTLEYIPPGAPANVIDIIDPPKGAG